MDFEEIENNLGSYWDCSGCFSTNRILADMNPTEENLTKLLNANIATLELDKIEDKIKGLNNGINTRTD